MPGVLDLARIQLFSAAQLLDAWEAASAETPLARPLRLLAAVSPDAAPPPFDEMSIGARDAALLALRERTFGPELTCVAACPQCSETLELQFTTDHVRAAEPVGLSTLSAGDYEVSFRLATTSDLVAVAGEPDVDTARQRLLERCILTPRVRGEECSMEAVPDEVLSAVVERMGEMDSQANVALSVRCPQCSHEWQTPVDIASFFWAELDAWAVRTLSEVHALASAYGWREADILTMSARRRQAYLSLMGTVE
ncbi:phage baseplate protein [Candidatus Binatia bacterium]|nr:phage baseplate protein [Candidatus Binatia bacterium]